MRGLKLTDTKLAKCKQCGRNPILKSDIDLYRVKESHIVRCVKCGISTLDTLEHRVIDRWNTLNKAE